MTRGQIEVIPSGMFQGLWLWLDSRSAILLTGEIPKEFKNDRTKPLEQRRMGVV